MRASKQREKRRLLEAKSFGEFGEKWLTAAPMADSTRAMRGRSSSASCCPGGANRLLTEITPDDLRAHCGAIVERGAPAPATAIHVRDKLIEKVGDAADHPARHASLLQTMVRKSELQDATWDEVDFENAVWTIPKERMKRSKARTMLFVAPDARHHDRAEDLRREFAILVVLPSRYDADAPMSRATFNRVTYSVVELAKKEGLPLEPFTVHDLRRTGSATPADLHCAAA